MNLKPFRVIPEATSSEYRAERGMTNEQRSWGVEIRILGVSSESGRKHGGEIGGEGRDMISATLLTFQGSTYLEQSLDPETLSL
jgi:hypothetical protein